MSRNPRRVCHEVCNDNCREYEVYVWWSAIMTGMLVMFAEFLYFLFVVARMSWVKMFPNAFMDVSGIAIAIPIFVMWVAPLGNVLLMRKFVCCCEECVENEEA